MTDTSKSSNEIFSFHLATLPLTRLPRFLSHPVDAKKATGLQHVESFFIMNLGEAVLGVSRYSFKKVGLFAWWKDEESLTAFLQQPSNKFLEEGWHVRMRLYRRWGQVSEIADAIVAPELAKPGEPVVAVTLARLKLHETFRFTKWGRPVESQVRDHKGKTLALAAMRPLNTFSTFSIWQNESEMLGMVQGRNPVHDGENHKHAMKEMFRKQFHHEFTTLRFTPFREVGSWNGRSNYIFK